MTQLRCNKCKKVVIDDQRCHCANKFIIASVFLMIISGGLISFSLISIGMPLLGVSLVCLFLSFKYGSSTIRERTLIQESITNQNQYAQQKPYVPIQSKPTQARVATPTPQFHQPTVHHVVSTHTLNVPIQQTVINNNYNQSKNINMNGCQIGDGAKIVMDYNDNRSNYDNNNQNQNINGNIQGNPIFAPNNKGNINYNQEKPYIPPQNP